MNKIISLLAAVFSALIVFTSCGGDKGVVPTKETISGPLGAYFKVVNRSYKINNGIINIEIERTNNGLPSPWKEGIEVGYSDNRVEPGFIVEFLDKDGDILCKDQTDIVWEKDELVATVSLAIGESTSIPFDAGKNKKIAKFKVSSTFEYHEPERQTYSSFSTTSSPESFSTESSSTGSKDWDDLLDSYEKYVDKYIALAKKANKGDASALSEYLSFLEKAQELSEQLSDAEDDMTSGQLKRYMDITAKMLEVDD